MIARAIKPTNTILICTHQVKDVENLIEEVIVLNEGEIIFKQHITSITAKLQFFDSHEPENIEHSLYNEKSLRGVHGIMRNIDHIDTKIDLELLYKGVLANASLINHQFNH